MENREIKISIRVLQLEDLSENYQSLIKLAKESTKNAYAPYSKFHVGAAILLDNNKIICGSNQENIAYPSGMCAERVAMYYANSEYPTNGVKAIAVAAFTNNKFTNTAITPCGACRQVLLETESRFGKPIEILLFGEKEILLIKSIKDLLPLSFSM